jgi:hypothetical protein
MKRSTAVLLAFLLMAASIVDASTFAREPLPDNPYGNGLGRHAGKDGAQYITPAAAGCAWGKQPARQGCLVACLANRPAVTHKMAADRHFLGRVRVQISPAFGRPASGRSPPHSPSVLAFQASR